MRKSKSISLFTITSDELYKRELFKALSKGIDPKYQVQFLELLDYIVTTKLKDFDIPELKGELYPDEDDISDLVLPAIRRVFGKVYTQPPPIFLGINDPDSVRLKLFQLNFNIDEFIEYFIDMLKRTKLSLLEFDYIDRTTQTLELIVDNYIAKLVKNVLSTIDIKNEIVRLEMELEREKKIKGLLND